MTSRGGPQGAVKVRTNETVGIKGETPGSPERNLLSTLGQINEKAYVGKLVPREKSGKREEPDSEGFC